MSPWPLSLLIAWPISASVFAAVFGAAAPLVNAAEQLEPLLAYEVTDEGVSFRVKTGGCTRKEHFRLDPPGTESDHAIALRRDVPDHCKGNFPEGIEIQFTFEELGLDGSPERIRIFNPLIPNH